MPSLPHLLLLVTLLFSLLAFRSAPIVNATTSCSGSATFTPCGLKKDISVPLTTCTTSFHATYTGTTVNGGFWATVTSSVGTNAYLAWASPAYLCLVSGVLTQVASASPTDTASCTGNFLYLMTGHLQNSNPYEEFVLNSILVNGATSESFTVYTTTDGSTANVPFTISFTYSTSYTISPSTVSGGNVGTAYSTVTFTENSASGSPTFSVSGNLPNGLSLDTSNGQLTGTPTTAGSFTFKSLPLIPIPILPVNPTLFLLALLLLRDKDVPWVLPREEGCKANRK